MDEGDTDDDDGEVLSIIVRSILSKYTGWYLYMGKRHVLSHNLESLAEMIVSIK